MHQSLHSFTLFVKGLNPQASNSRIEDAYLALSRYDPNVIPSHTELYQVCLAHSLIPLFHSYVHDPTTSSLLPPI